MLITFLEHGNWQNKGTIHEAQMRVQCKNSFQVFPVLLKIFSLNRQKKQP